jgi:YegS/Rv2252/BmrU family lipid kinase
MSSAPTQVVIANPASAAGETGRRWPELRARLHAHLGAFDAHLTQAPGHAIDLARQARARGAALVVALGGDGTVGEVASGLVRLDGVYEPPEPALGLVPAGTGCDLARSLGLEGLDAALQRLAAGRERRIDVGALCCQGFDGRAVERAFVNVLSFGCGGAVSRAITRSAKRLGGRLGFMLTTARVLLGWRDQPVRVALDRGPFQSLALTNYALCNGAYFGGGMWVAPGSQLDDGRFDVTVWSGFGLSDFVWQRRALYNGRHVDNPGTTRATARVLVAESDDQVLVDADGESVGRLPLRAELRPGALRLRA